MAISAGLRGDGTLTWLSSWPFEVLTKIMFSNDTGEEFAMLCCMTPSSSIMS